MGCGAGAHRLGVEGGVEGVLSTVSDDSSTTNSAPARRMSQVSERVRLWRPKEGEGLDALLTAHVGWADVKGLRIVVGWAQFGSSCLRQGRAGKWPFRMAGGRRTGSLSNAHDKPRCGSRSRCQRKWGSSTSGALESPVGSARAHGRIAFGQESPPWSCPCLGKILSIEVNHASWKAFLPPERVHFHHYRKRPHTPAEATSTVYF